MGRVTLIAMALVTGTVGCKSENDDVPWTPPGPGIPTISLELDQETVGNGDMVTLNVRLKQVPYFASGVFDPGNLESYAIVAESNDGGMVVMESGFFPATTEVEIVWEQPVELVTLLGGADPCLEGETATESVGECQPVCCEFDEGMTRGLKARGACEVVGTELDLGTTECISTPTCCAILPANAEFTTVPGVAPDEVIDAARLEQKVQCVEQAVRYELRQWGCPAIDGVACAVPRDFCGCCDLSNGPELWLTESDPTALDPAIIAHGCEAKGGTTQPAGSCLDGAPNSQCTNDGTGACAVACCQLPDGRVSVMDSNDCFYNRGTDLGLTQDQCPFTTTCCRDADGNHRFASDLKVYEAQATITITGMGEGTVTFRLKQNTPRPVAFEAETRGSESATLEIVAPGDYTPPGS